MITLSVDPGHDGGAVLLDPTGHRALLAWGWEKLDRVSETVYRLVRPEGRSLVHVSECASLSEVAVTIRRDVTRLSMPAYHLVVERLFVPSQEPGEETRTYLGRLARVLTLGELTGQLYGPLLKGAARLDRPFASQWRADVLGLLPSCSSDDSEARAVALLTDWESFDLAGPLVTGLPEGLAKNPHVAEAACMAVWGHRLRHPPQQGLFGGGVQ